MSWRVNLSQSAHRDVRQIVAYLVERSKPGALAWKAAFTTACDRLRLNPNGWPLAPEDELFDITIRQAVFRSRSGRSYRAVFIVEGNLISILRVRGPGQDLLGFDDLDVPEIDT